VLSRETTNTNLHSLWLDQIEARTNINMTMYIYGGKKGFCWREILSGNNKKFPHGRSLLLEQVTFRWDDDDICFVLDQHTEFDFYCTNSLKQQSTWSYSNVAPLKDTLTWVWVNMSLFLNAAWLIVKKQKIHILLVNWIDSTRSTTMKTSTPTMTSEKQKIRLW
jgi:hypothetical protein